MTKEDNKNKIYVYLDRYPDGVDGTYRDLEDVLGINHTTIYRIINDSDDINAKSKGDGNSKETKFILKKYETKKVVLTKPVHPNFEEPIDTKEIKFTTRQHLICDYGLARNIYANAQSRVGEENVIDKVEMLYDLRDLFFSEERLEKMDYSWKHIVPRGHNIPMGFRDYFLQNLKPIRYTLTEYAALTKDLRFISDHPEIRQVMWGSKGGRKGGVWILRKGEEMDQLDLILYEALTKLKRFQRRKKGLKQQANTRLVFKHEKDVMDILREFDL